MGGLKAQLENDGDVLIVRFTGRIDVESAAPFRQACATHLKGRKVVFDFNALNFVGSSGILPFLEAMEDFARANPNGIKLSGIGVEFGRILSATELQRIEQWEKPSDAVFSYRHPQSAISNVAYGLTNGTPAVAATATPLLALRYERDDREIEPTVEE